MRKWYRRSGTGFLLAALVLVLSSTAFAANFVVIAHKGVSVGSLSKADAQAMFLGEKTKWDDGKPVKIAVLEEGEAHKAFLQGVVGKTPSQFDNSWKKLIFTGKASAPKTFGDMSALVGFVAATPGAIGYVSPGQAGNSVNTISIK